MQEITEPLPTWTDYPPGQIETVEEDVEDEDDDDGVGFLTPCNLWFFNVSVFEPMRQYSRTDEPRSVLSSPESVLAVCGGFFRRASIRKFQVTKASDGCCADEATAAVLFRHQFACQPLGSCLPRRSHGPPSRKSLAVPCLLKLSLLMSFYTVSAEMAK
jgi:hypothetical protein